MEWRSIKIGGKWLLVSNMGDVFDYSTNRCVRLFDSGDGYLRFKAGFVKVSVHRVVADLFIECDDTSKVVNHINHIKKDNRASNLEWVTPVENLLAYRDFRAMNPEMYALIRQEDLKRKRVNQIKAQLRLLLDKRVVGYQPIYFGEEGLFCLVSGIE